MEFDPPPRLHPLLWIALAGLLLMTATLALAASDMKLSYVYVSHDSNLPASRRTELIAPWKAEIERNTRDFSYAPAISTSTGLAPASLLIGEIGPVTITVLSSLSTCENTGSTSIEPLCSAKILVEGRAVQAKSCFVEAVFDPLPGENTGNTYTSFAVDFAKRTVTLSAVRKGRPIAKCRRVVRF